MTHRGIILWYKLVSIFMKDSRVYGAAGPVGAERARVRARERERGEKEGLAALNPTLPRCTRERSASGASSQGGVRLEPVLGVDQVLS